MTENQVIYEVPLGRVLSVAPGLPTTDLARTIEHYRLLGFVFDVPGSEPAADASFAIAERDGIELHFAVERDHDPDRDWRAPWSGQTPLDVARDQRQGPVVAWLIEAGAREDGPG